MSVPGALATRATLEVSRMGWGWALPSAARRAEGAGTTGLRLSGPAFGVHPERRHREFLPKHARVGLDLMRAYGQRPDAAALTTWRGHSFTALTGDLLAGLAEPLPELDLIVLAYQTPDLHVAEAAGCHLAQRCPGDPDSFAISEQGPGATFTALRVADAMLGAGALRHGLLFVLDQTSPIHEPGTPRDYRDAAVMFRCGRSGEAELASVTETATDDPGRELAGLRAGTRTVVGTALAGQLGGSTADYEVAPAGHAITSVWLALARLWPLAEPVLLADYDPYAGRLHTCRLIPVER